MGCVCVWDPVYVYGLCMCMGPCVCVWAVYVLVYIFCGFRMDCVCLDCMSNWLVNYDLCIMSDE